MRWKPRLLVMAAALAMMMTILAGAPAFAMTKEECDAMALEENSRGDGRSASCEERPPGSGDWTLVVQYPYPYPAPAPPPTTAGEATGQVKGAAEPVARSSTELAAISATCHTPQYPWYKLGGPEWRTPDQADECLRAHGYLDPQITYVHDLRAQAVGGVALQDGHVQLLPAPAACKADLLEGWVDPYGEHVKQCLREHGYAEDEAKAAMNQLPGNLPWWMAGLRMLFVTVEGETLVPAA
jgi:hypothetical protein